MTEEILNDYVDKIQSFNMNEDKRFDAVHIKDAVMAGYNICRSECEKSDLENAIRIGALEEERDKNRNMVFDKDDQLTKAKEIINAFLDFEASAMERGCYISDDTRRRAEDFIKE